MNVLITGGSGLVGLHLTELLQRHGHKVRWLGRSSGGESRVTKYYWHPAKNEIDDRALRGITHIVHLAGAGLADRRWTRTYKKELVSSRVRSAGLLLKAVMDASQKPQAFISAGAVGYYGTADMNETFDESHPAGNDFLAALCTEWENAALKFREAALRVCVVRTAVVLSEKGGALKKMLPLFRLGLGAPLGTGAQPFPWIHISDLAAIYHRLLTDENADGPYNAVAPDAVTNAALSAAIAKSLGKPFFMHRVPSAILKLVLGEMAGTLTTGQRVVPTRLLNSGFEFSFPCLNPALKNLLAGKK